MGFHHSATRRRFLGLVAAASLTAGAFVAAPASAAEPASADPTGTLRLAPTTNVQTFDPAKVQNAQLYYLQPVYDTLLRLDAENTPQPGIAESWEWDGTVATLTLRDGPVFTDGTPIDAEAVKANLDRFVEIAGPQVTTYANLESVEAPDATTVVLTFTGPSPSLLTDLAQAPGMMMNPADFESTSLDTEPAGTSGPYVLDDSTSAAGDRFVYTPSDTYWDPEAQHVGQIEILPIPDEAARSNALQNGELEVTSVGYAQVDQFVAQGFEATTFPGYLWFAAIFDRNGKTQPALAEPQVRKAMAIAIDREAIAEGVFFGHATPTPQPNLEGELGYVASLADADPFDPDAARELLAEAGYADGFDIKVPAIPSTQNFVQAVANYWNDIGINTEVELIQAGAQAEAARSGDYTVFVTPTAMGDPNNWYRSFWAPNSPYNRVWEVLDPELDELALAAATPVDAAERQAGYDELFPYAIEQGLFVPVVRGDQIAMHPAEVTNVTWHINEFFPNPITITLEG